MAETSERAGCVEQPGVVLIFEMLGLRIRAVCTDLSAASVINANYVCLAAHAAETSTADLHYTVARAGDAGAYHLTCCDEPPVEAADPGELLFLLEKHVTVALQRCRPDLLFFHAAALEHAGKVYLLAGDSGQGKSTTTWGLLHHGFRYLSDELAPVQLSSLTVHAYPHALCLKRQPPAPYPLPADRVIDLGDTLHVPADALPSPALTAPGALAAVIFVGYQPARAAPALHAIGAAEAAARLYVTALNALAHPNRGLDAVAHIARHTPCFALDAADLRSTCELVLERFSNKQAKTPGG